MGVHESLKTMFQVTIHEHQDQHPVLELDSDFPTKGTWEDDWEKTVPPCVNMDFPCFILYRLDEKDGSGNYMWILISWSPDIAHTRSEITILIIKIEYIVEKVEDVICINKSHFQEGVWRRPTQGRILCQYEGGGHPVWVQETSQIRGCSWSSVQGGGGNVGD